MADRAPLPTGKLFGISSIDIAPGQAGGVSGSASINLAEEVFEKVDFRNSLHDIGLGKPVTGSQIFDNISNVYLGSKQTPFSGAFIPESSPINMHDMFTKGTLNGKYGPITTTPNSIYLDKGAYAGAQAEDGAYLLFHELGHSARTIDNAEYTAQWSEAARAANTENLTIEQAKILGREEGAADVFARSLMEKAGVEVPTSGASYSSVGELNLAHNIKEPNFFHGVPSYDDKALLKNFQQKTQWVSSDTGWTEVISDPESALRERPGLAKSYLNNLGGATEDIAFDPSNPNRHLYTAMRDAYDEEYGKTFPIEDYAPAFRVRQKQIAEEASKQANKLKSFADNPDDLYAKYLDHVGRIKSEGGILNSGGGLVPDFYSNDPVEIGEKALRNLAEQEGLTYEVYELSKILNTNTNYEHQILVNQAKNRRKVQSSTGETIDDLKANPKYSPSGSATIEEIETVLKKEQVQMMRSRGLGLPTGASVVADANANLVAAAKNPLTQPDEADFLPQKMINGRPSVTLNYGKMSTEELIDSRAKIYSKLLDPEYANQKPGVGGAGGFHTLDRGNIRGVEGELTKRGEDLSMLPDVPAYDPDYVPGSGKRGPYLRSKYLDDYVDEAVAQSEVVIAGASSTASAASAADNLAATVAASAPVHSVAPASAVAEAVVTSGSATAAGAVTAAAAAATKASNGILNIGKKIISKPKNMAAVGIAVAAGAIAFRSN